MSGSVAATAAPAARVRPPFRADHVGSLLRPKALQEARAEWKAGRLDHDGLRVVEDRCIAAAIARQEEIGLRAVTDGEYRRAYWHYDFVSGLDGVEIYEPEQKIQFKGGVLLPHALRVTGRIGWAHPVMVDDYRFVASHAGSAMAKQTIPSPSVVHFRGGGAPSTRRRIPNWGRSLLIWQRRISERSGRSRRPGAVICRSMKSTSPICVIPNRSPDSRPGASMWRGCWAFTPIC